MKNKLIVFLKTASVFVFVFLFALSAHIAQAFVFNNNLSTGSISQEVKELQKYLNANGYIVSASGPGSIGNETNYFGPLTRSALAKFQADNKIYPPVGFFGPITRGFINDKASEPVAVTNPIAIINNEPVPVMSQPAPISIDSYSVGGTITGLIGSVTLFNNGGDSLTLDLNSNSGFVFPTKLANGFNYEVSVRSNVPGQACYVNEMSSGVISGSNITGVKVACGRQEIFNPFIFIPPSSATAVSAATSILFSPSSGLIPLTIKLVSSAATVGTSVSISGGHSGGSIYYTTDGSYPSRLNTLYSGPLTINSNTTINAVSSKSGSDDTAVSVGSYSINTSTTTAFSMPHGSVQVGNKFYMVTRTKPATITVFNNPDDLSDSQTETLTGHQKADLLVYDSVNDKLYASVFDQDANYVDATTTIISINPDDITDWSVVFSDKTTLPTQFTPPIATDGTYLYGATFQPTNTKLFKIQISDWTLATSTIWNSTGSYAHAVSLVEYATRTEMYVTTVYGTQSKFAKAIVSSSTITVSSVGLGDSGTVQITDDIACQYVDENGATCYAGADINATTKIGRKINTAAMTVSTFSQGSTGCYGMFIYNGDLYSLGTNKTIIRYQNLDTDSPEIFSTGDITPNELFYLSGGRFFVTNWNSTDGVTPVGESYLTEFKFAQ